MRERSNRLNDNKLDELVRKIKNNVNKRKRNLPYLAASGSNGTMDIKSAINLEQDIQFIYENSDIQNDTYIIKSHRPFLGYFLIKGREFVNSEIKRYLDPILLKQSRFNRSLVRIVSEIRNAMVQNQDTYSALSYQIQLINERCDIYDSWLKSTSITPLDRSIERRTKWSELYSKDFSEKDMINNIEYHSHFIELIRKYAKLSAELKIPKIIEIGLSSGSISIYLSRNELYEVYGVDNDIDVLKHCIGNNIKLGGNVKFLLIDAFYLNILKKKEFDVAFSQRTPELFDNKAIISLLSKQLEIANYVVFSVPSIHLTTPEIDSDRKMELEEWRTLLNERGFNILNLEYYNENLYIAGVIS
jgi:hypothetical protein